VDLLDAYLSCLLHDIKKVLLNAKKGDPDYASWRPDHYKLDDLWTQIDPAKVALPKALSVHSDSLKNDHRIRLANLHHNEPTAPRRDLDPVAIYAIQAADKTHKALYFPEEPRQSGSGPDIEVNRKLPCHYPFFGLPCYWRPDDDFGGDLPATGREEVEWRNSTQHFKKIFGAVSTQRNTSAGITPRGALQLLEDFFSDFPESTYLPVTSLNFHLRLAGALFLLFYRVFAGVREVTAYPVPCELTLALTTITTPVERLRNRLRDVRNIRKISQQLQEKLHAALRQEYLDAVAPDAFRHPSSNPFLFYSKDALVILHAESELARLREICSQVAKECGTDIGLYARLIRVPASLRISGFQDKRDPIIGQPLSKLDPERTKAGIDIEPLERLATVSERFSCSPQFSPSAEQACFTCGEPHEPLELREDRGDKLCCKCFTLRRGYKFCPSPDCFTYTLQPTCPHCGRQTEPPPTPRLLRDQHEDRPTNRVAYVMVATNCLPDPEVLRAETELLLARYRRDRSKFTHAWTRNEINHLSETRSTRFCLYEYLQAALDMAKFQRELEGLLRDCLPQDEIPRNANEAEQERLTRVAMESYFLYRSPSLTVVLLEERQLDRFWQGLRDLLKRLNVSWAAKAVTCNVHFPVWAVLREFLDRIDFLPNAQEKAEEIREAAKTWYSRPQGESSPPDIVGMGEKLLEEAESDRQRVHEKHSGLVVLRGSIERNFPLDVSDYLLGVSRKQLQARPPLAQLGFVSEFASEVCQPHTDRAAALEDLAMELDSRSGREREKIDPELAATLYQQFTQVKVEEIPGFVRELATQLKVDDQRQQAERWRQRHVQPPRRPPHP
jgi:rRNA maturation protein Nop10